MDYSPYILFPHADSKSFLTLAVIVSVVAVATFLIVIALVVSAYCQYQKRRYNYMIFSMKWVSDQNLFYSFSLLIENTIILMELRAATATQRKAMDQFTSLSSTALTNNVNMSM